MRGHAMLCAVCYNSRYADVDQPLSEPIMARARRFVSEWRLVVEGRQLNLRHGLAIPTRMLLHAACAQGDCLPKCVEYHQSMSPLGNATCGGRVWAHRFRRRCGARVGKIELAEPLSVAEMHTKVLHSCISVYHVAYFPSWFGEYFGALYDVRALHGIMLYSRLYAC